MEEYGKISFAKFWTLLERKHLNKQHLINNGIHRATVYKIARDEQGNRLTYMKITGGSLKVKEILSADTGDGRDKKIQIRPFR